MQRDLIMCAIEARLYELSVPELQELLRTLDKREQKV